MSNFYCHVCKKTITDTPGGWYVTGCEHFPLEKPEKKDTTELEVLKKIFNL